MSLYDINQKILGELGESAKEWHPTHPVFSADLFKILGITTMLHERETTLRQYTESSSVTEIEARALLDHVLLLVKNGLAIVESRIMPFTDQGQRGRMLQVMTAKLRASFYHTLSQYHNESVNPPAPACTKATTTSHPASTTPRPSNIAQQLKPSPEKTTSWGTSFLTNAWSQALDTDKGNVPPDDRPYSWGLQPLSSLDNIDNFIMSKQDNIPRTRVLFQSASTLAKRLPGSSPMRLAIMLEHTIFLAGCVGDETAAQSVSQRAVKDCYSAKEHIEGPDFEDAVVPMLALKKYENAARVVSE